ncbi:MAG: sugar kinase [Desulfomonile sp.]|nr:sugar kinase [Desulfomonile sp.]
MSWLIVGTIPYEGFPLVEASCALTKDSVRLGDRAVRVVRGTAALAAAACLTVEVLGIQPPTVLLAGDIGRGDGSTSVYRRMVDRVGEVNERLIVFHYLMPDVRWHDRILMALEELAEKPVLVADAGYMYVAKMSGSAPSYDLFTPDAGEIAFLADENAPHPFYTRGFLLQEEERVPELISRAYEHENAARYLLVKGRSDLIASKDGILAEVVEPCVDAMEPIGGTGDSLTGIVAALLAAGKAIPEAAFLAAKTNRLLGSLSNPTPAFSVADLLPALPNALEMALSH